MAYTHRVTWDEQATDGNLVGLTLGKSVTANKGKMLASYLENLRGDPRVMNIRVERIA